METNEKILSIYLLLNPLSKTPFANEVATGAINEVTKSDNAAPRNLPTLFI